jgi:nucleotide-binding universal stress UspA family protein
MELPKIDIKKILYATDLSENARVAFAYAVSLANLYDAQLVMLHVVPEDRALDEQVAGYVDAKLWKEIKSRHLEEARSVLIGKRREHLAIEEVLNHFRKDAGRQLNKSAAEADDIMVESGEPVEKIVAVAEKSNCDLIVMGRHGYGALKDALMGGVARGVLRRSAKPVLLIRLPEE